MRTIEAALAGGLVEAATGRGVALGVDVVAVFSSDQPR